MRGTKNEAAVMSAIKAKPYIADLWDVGIMERRDATWLVCSPDELALVKFDALPASFQSSSPLAAGDALACVEIKTSVAASSLDRVVALGTDDLII